MKNSKMHELWNLGAPTILEQALQTIVAYVDTAMVGQISAIASAAVGLTTTVNWLLNGILFAVSVGMLSFIAQYTGEGDYGSCTSYISTGDLDYFRSWRDRNSDCISNQSGTANVDGRQSGNLGECKCVFLYRKLPIDIERELDRIWKCSKSK